MGRRELFSLGELKQVENDHPEWDDHLLAKHFGVSKTAIKNKRAQQKETKKKVNQNLSQFHIYKNA